jgi:hypothetical protein
MTAGLVGSALLATVAFAQSPTAPSDRATAMPAAGTSHTSTAMAAPSMTGPLVANPNPYSFDDPFGVFGKIYVTGAISGLGLVQSNPGLGDRVFHGDASNAQVIAQKTDGLFQFYVQAGMYSFPAIGTPYVSASSTPLSSFVASGLVIG